ncbi:uncharacterized protein SCHCODRAFT_02611073, partial [Schizophyllum commune H4-8]|uniref:uncharacterized protein n=1 Tax=Schizophyllum commune (strain H4-8 / FGSC 9210) TaxID=578458 RepID=UPI00215EAAB6
MSSPVRIRDEHCAVESTCSHGRLVDSTTTTSMATTAATMTLASSASVVRVQDHSDNILPGPHDVL